MFFERRITIRFREDELKVINQIVKQNQDIYDGVSHFIRVAAIKLIREHKQVSFK